MDSDSKRHSAPGDTSTGKSTERLLRLPDVELRVGLKRATIYRHMKAGTFPRCVTLTTKCVAWPESRIEAWIASRLAASPAS